MSGSIPPAPVWAAWIPALIALVGVAVGTVLTGLRDAVAFKRERKQREAEVRRNKLEELIVKLSDSELGI